MFDPKQGPLPHAARARVRRFWDAYREASRARAADDLAAAAAHYRDALELQPGHEDALYYLGNCCFEMGRYPEAVAAYERLVAANPLGSSRGYIQLGLIHACLEAGAPRDLARAEHFFRRALEVDPDSGALLGLSEVAILRGRWLEARERLKRAHADNPMSVAAPYLLGYLCWRRGERDGAWRWFREAVRRCEVKKPPVPWTEEGDVKADPALRWRALARQSVFGRHWLRLRDYRQAPDLSPAAMEREYRRLGEALRRSL